MDLDGEQLSLLRDGGGGDEVDARSRVKPLDVDCKQSRQRFKRLTKGCTNLMYACQQGNTQDIVKELRSKVNAAHIYILNQFKPHTYFI